MGKNEKVIIGSDHRGYDLKETLLTFLRKEKIDCFDAGTDTGNSVDYPKFAAIVAKKVSSGEFKRGVLICGMGIGMSIAANKFKNIRAALCINTHMAEMSRKHNDANILVLSSMQTDEKLAKKIFITWFQTEFAGGRHKLRLDLIKKIEQEKDN